MNQTVILYFDNLDDRKEVLTLLERLQPWKRLAWLRWCCTACPGLPGSTKRPGIQPGHSGLAMECFMDFWLMVGYYRLDPEAALKQLTEMVRGKV